MSLLLKAIRERGSRKVVQFPELNAEVSVFYREPDDVCITLFSSLKNEYYEKMKTEFNRSEKYSATIRDEEWDDSKKAFWGDDDRPETWSEYYSQINSFKAAVTGIAHMVLVDSEGNPVCESETEISELRDFLRVHSDSVIQLTRLFTESISYRNDLFKKKLDSLRLTESKSTLPMPSQEGTD